MDTIREILARYGVPAETVPLHGDDVRPLAEALERRESEVIAGVGLAMGIRIREAIVVADKRAEERAPDLADWVAAACRSRLGDPAQRHDCDAMGFDWPAANVGVSIALGPIAGYEATVWIDDGGHEHYATPAELRAELDRIAGGGS